MAKKGKEIDLTMIQFKYKSTQGTNLIRAHTHTHRKERERELFFYSLGYFTKGDLLFTIGSPQRAPPFPPTALSHGKKKKP